MADPITIKELTIGERAGALRLIDGFRGGLQTMRILLEDIKNFTITKEEWETAKLVKTPNAQGETWNWDDEAVKKDVTVQPETLAYLKQEITRRSDANDITLADIAISTLEKKLV